MIRWFVLLMLCFSFRVAYAQVTENFSDGDFTVNPAWSGTASDWLVNPSLQLQSNNTVANSSFYLSTPNTLATEIQWDLYLRLSFNTSSTNYMDVFLTSSAQDLTAAGTTGYFVRIGNTQDEISLYRKDAAGSVKLIDGADGTTNSSDNTIRLRVIRTVNGQFRLLRDLSGSGNSFQLEGIATDLTYNTTAWFGFLVKQSTAAFFQRHYVDDINIQPYVPDTTPPSVISVSVNDATNLDLMFSEPVDPQTALDAGSYLVSGSLIHPVQVVADVVNNTLMHLVFASPFAPGISYQLSVSGVKDLAGNMMTGAIVSFSYAPLRSYDVVISEIMADPSPVVGLPNAEYVEVKNVSGRAIQLIGWRLTCGSSNSGSFPNYLLLPDSILILTSSAQATALSPFGKTLSVPSFPSLPNEGGLLSLQSAGGLTIHAVNYQLEWIENAVKADGGYSLEMIDTHNPCSGGSNWTSSHDSRGGTPGQRNSVDGVNPDNTPPRLVRTYTLDSLHIVAVFDEPADSSSAALPLRYTMTGNMQVLKAEPQPPLFTTVLLQLSGPLLPQVIYTLKVNDVADCQGNTLGQFREVRAGKPEEVMPGDLVINEVLFNPKPGGVDYVEVYNRSKKIVDASLLFIASRNSSGQITGQRKWLTQPFLFFPGDHLVLTEDPSAVAAQFLVRDQGSVLKVPSFPSLPDDSGALLITSQQGMVIDELHYSDKWQFALIRDAEGIALERTDPEGKSQDPMNWHSAASTFGYGTPTARNSQYRQPDDGQALLTISPVFSPDNDGFEDLALIHYSVEESGYLANLNLYDGNGNRVRQLVRNGLLGRKGTWTWDGLDDAGHRLSMGTYILVAELFNLQGKKKAYKFAVVLARRK
jgi:hypothetical protein